MCAVWAVYPTWSPISLCCISTGKTFVAPWTENLTQISKLFPISVKPSNGNKTAPATLCQWSEVLEHPGLMLCLTHTTGLPVVLMVQPNNISVSITAENYTVEYLYYIYILINTVL